MFQIKKHNPIIINLLPILQKSLDRALFLYNFICKVQSRGVTVDFHSVEQ